MLENLEIKPSEDLAYWIGVAQTDGCFNKYINKHNGKIRYRVDLVVGEKSLPMLIKFNRLSYNLFKRKSGILKLGNGEFGTYISVKELLATFVKLNIIFDDTPSPPNWTKHDEKLFGAYLAGIIDGDGNVEIKRPKYLQCLIIIFDGSSQDELALSIKNMLKCSVKIYKFQKMKNLHNKNTLCTWYELHFLLSNKNSEFFYNYILPHLTIEHKRDKTSKFLETRYFVYNLD